MNFNSWAKFQTFPSSFRSIPTLLVPIVYIRWRIKSSRPL